MHQANNNTLLSANAGDLPMAEAYYSRCISLPMFPSMMDADIDRVIYEIRSFLQSS